MKISAKYKIYWIMDVYGGTYYIKIKYKTPNSVFNYKINSLLDSSFINYFPQYYDSRRYFLSDYSNNERNLIASKIIKDKGKKEIVKMHIIENLKKITRDKEDKQKKNEIYNILVNNWEKIEVEINDEI